MNDAVSALTTRRIGETENALRAVLERLLAPTGLNYYSWVALRVIAQPASRAGTAIVQRLRDGLKIDGQTADATLDGLLRDGLIEAVGGELVLAKSGETMHGRIMAEVRRCTDEMFADIATVDLVTTDRVLSTIVNRANTILGRDLG